MLPKNKLRDLFYNNILIFNGPDHDLHKIGLPQFGAVKPINFNKMMGNELDPELDELILNPDFTKEEVNQLREKGVKIKEDPEWYLYDFMKKKAHTIKNYGAIINYLKKIQNIRRKKWNKIKMKNYTYV